MKKTRLSLNISLCLSLIAISLAHATPKSKKASPKSKAASTSRPVNLGNGIFVLGEGTSSMPVVVAARPVVERPEQRKATQDQTNAKLVRFCRSYLGRKLGNGQCSELAVYGLPAANARLDFNNLWGSYVCQYSASGGRLTVALGAAGRDPKNPRRVDVRPGDILQYENVRFEKRWNGGYSYQAYPHHTSIIERVSRDGSTVKVLEQNINGTQYVLETELYLPEMTEGTLRISRPIPQ
jgi:hypothetical protein